MTIEAKTSEISLSARTILFAAFVLGLTIGFVAARGAYSRPFHAIPADTSSSPGHVDPQAPTDRLPALSLRVPRRS